VYVLSDRLRFIGTQGTRIVKRHRFANQHRELGNREISVQFSLVLVRTLALLSVASGALGLVDLFAGRNGFRGPSRPATTDAGQDQAQPV